MCRLGLQQCLDIAAFFSQHYMGKRVVARETLYSLMSSDYIPGLSRTLFLVCLTLAHKWAESVSMETATHEDGTYIEHRQFYHSSFLLLLFTHCLLLIVVVYLQFVCCCCCLLAIIGWWKCAVDVFGPWISSIPLSSDGATVQGPALESETGSMGTCMELFTESILTAHTSILTG